ncbi:3792_t:CDS:1, partial [Cetraspora pellucida]
MAPSNDNEKVIISGKVSDYRCESLKMISCSCAMIDDNIPAKLMAALEDS